MMLPPPPPPRHAPELHLFNYMWGKRPQIHLLRLTKKFVVLDKTEFQTLYSGYQYIPKEKGEHRRLLVWSGMNASGETS